MYCILYSFVLHTNMADTSFVIGISGDRVIYYLAHLPRWWMG